MELLFSVISKNQIGVVFSYYSQYDPTDHIHKKKVYSHLMAIFVVPTIILYTRSF